MAGLLALIDLTRQRHQSVDHFAETISQRVRGMTRVHSLLSSHDWQPIDLDALLTSLLPTHTIGSFVTDGPAVIVPPGVATAMGMLIQELFSNSLSHGALNHISGCVAVQWKIERSPMHSYLELEWRETGGPPITAPPTPKLGTELIQGFARHELRGSIELRFPPEGVQHTLISNFDWSNVERRLP